MQIYANQVDQYLAKLPSSLKFALIYGADEGLVTIILRKIIKCLNNKSELNIIRYLYKQIKEAPIILRDEIVSISLLGDTKVIIIEDCVESLSKEIEEIIKKITPIQSFIIFIGGEIKKSSRICSIFESLKNSITIPCYKSEVNDLQKIIQKFFSDHTILYENEVPRLLAEILPPNQLLIKNELEKLILYKNHSKINISDVMEVFQDESDISLDKLCFAFVMDDKLGITYQIGKLNYDLTNFMLILRVLQKYIIRLITVKIAMLHGQDLQLAISYLRPPIFSQQRSNFVYIIQNIAVDRLFLLLKRLLNIEVDCKKTGLNSELLLNQFLISNIN